MSYQCARCGRPRAIGETLCPPCLNDDRFAAELRQRVEGMSDGEIIRLAWDMSDNIEAGCDLHSGARKALLAALLKEDA